VLTDPEPLLPTRTYRVLCHDATLIDLEAVADGRTARSSPSRSPRQVVVQRCGRADVDLVLRDDGAVWPPLSQS
jgi:hypothetical protein